MKARLWERGGQFTFQLKDADGKVIAEAKNDKNGAVMFDTVKFKQAYMNILF
ncbi:MAG: hypothetical protein V8R14_08955 [Clostridia bacterium]